MKDIARYKPTQTSTSIPLENESQSTEPANHPIVNQSVIDLQSQYPDVLGWLTIDGTVIDYPFVQSEDNDDYLRSDLNGQSANAGTIFADCRCDGVNSFMTILYGHNMKDGTMFADLQKFSEEAFWNDHATGTVYLPNATYHLERIAFLVVSSSDSEIYAPGICAEEEISDFCSYLKQNARICNETELTTQDKVLVLSTCNYAFTGGRSVVVMKMTKEA